MTFLNPLALFGLLAASIPVLIHLLNLRKLKIIDFSSLKFLKELQKNKLRKIKIKQIILLILRVSAIVLLVLAFSRPTIKNFNFIGLGSEAKSTIFIFLDNSLSMSLTDKTGQYLLQSKRKANEIMNLVKESDEVYFIPMSEIDISRLDYLPVSKIFLSKFINKVELSYHNNNYEKALILASKLLEKSGNFQKDIYFISDFQRNNLSEKPQNLDSYLDNLTNLYLVDIGKKNAENYSLDSIQIIDKIFESSKPVNFENYLANRTDSEIKELVSNLSFNNEKVGQKGIDIPAKENRVAVLNGKAKTSGFIAVKSETEDDDFNFDNIRYTGFYIPEKINILLATDNISDGIFIKLALSQTIDENSKTVNTLTQINSNQINSYNLDNFDVVLLSGSENIKDYSRLKSYIEKGGRICIFPGANSSPISFNNLTSTFGFNNMLGVTGNSKNQSSFIKFDKIDFAHPIFKNIFIDEKRKNIEPPEIYFSFNYKSDLTSQSIIDYQNGYSFLIEKKSGLGKILLFTTSTSLNWSNLSLKGIFLPMMNKIVQYLSYNENRIDFTTVGKNYLITLNGRNEKQLQLVYPDNQEKLLPVKENNNYQYVSVSSLDIPGIYYLKNKDKILKLLIVNMNNLESDLSKASTTEITDFFNKISKRIKTNLISPEENLTKVVTQDRLGTELWKFLVILTLLCLLAEMIIARTSKKELLTN